MTGEMIGRDVELSDVRAFLDRPVDGLRALVLEGEAGIGKSTIWQAGVVAARERSFRVLVSSPAEAERTLPYVVLGDLFAQTGSEALDQLEVPRRRAFESALLRAEADLPVDPRALGVAIVTLLPLLAGTGPLVLAIDDDQWMDASSAATLGFALRRSLEQPVLLLVSRRVDDVPAPTADAWMSRIEVGRLHIGELSVGAIQSLLRSRLDGSFPRPTLLRLHEASGGNPFHALELARARMMDPTRDLTAPLAVPPSLERLVAARLDALATPTRRALFLIAAHGRMPIGLLRALGVTDAALEHALTANVVANAQGVVSFTHPLLASAIYQKTASAERRDAHLRLAAALDDPVDRGRHLALASDEPSDTLAASLESAALVARDRGIPMAAAELAEHSIRLTPADAPDDRHRRAVAAARAHLEAGAGGRARAIAAEVLARASGGAQRAEALVLGSETEDVGLAVSLLEKALAEAAGVPALEATIHAGLAEVGRATKGSAWAERHAREALQLAERLDDDAVRSRALAVLAQDAFERGDPQAFELVERAHQLARSLGDPHRVSWADEMMGAVLTFSGDYERAREWLLRVLDYWRDRDEQVRSLLLWLLALGEVWTGRWSAASEYADQVRDISVQYGEVSTDHLSPALIALHRGQIEVARDHSRRALLLADGHLLPQHVAVLGVCDLWSGSPAAALVHLIEAEQTADLRGWHEPNMRWWRADYAEALLQVGRVEDAAQLVADWEAAATRLDRERVLAQAVRCRGLIAAALGDVATALALLEEAADRHESVGDPFNRARALLALGGVRLRARQKRTAREALEAALAGFEDLGAAGWAATARSELARIGGRERIEGLSPSELRVAELVAEGRTNREIASLLFLGERTVAGHLTHVYAKLGIRSRTELARQLPPRTGRSAEKASKVATS
jgi:DNA-binding CsgD family transcriptional regulator